MKGSERRLVQYLEGADKRFIIPVYQRNYDWKIENCKQLYDDLIKVIKKGRESHFFGSLVSVYEPSGANVEYLVIDGQQRLTTVSLLLLAMHNLIKEKVVEPGGKLLGERGELLSERIYNEYLVDKYQPGETRIKLKPVKNDQEAFHKLFDDASEHNKASNLTINYNYFYERIQKGEITIDELFVAITKLMIIDIELSSNDDPQLIFESLNSTGLDLNEGDKIRNYVLMGLSKEQQEKYYDKYWNPIEMRTKYNVSSFVRDYLSVKQGAIPNEKKVYSTFKDYAEQKFFDVASTKESDETGANDSDEKKALNTECLLKDMLSYAKRYEILLGEGTDSKILNSCIDRLNRLETTVTRPFFLEVLRLWDESKLDLSDVSEIFLTTEKYLFRRTICELPSNSLNKTFLSLHRDIFGYEGNDENYLEKFKYALLSKKDNARFPDDTEFSRCFSEREVYKMNPKNKIYILERLENAGTKEVHEVYKYCEADYGDGKWTIEHIMPRTLTPAWKTALGDNWEETHNKWLHRIANLTLTAYNSELSNNSFEDKKKNGFTDSGIRLNAYVAGCDKWTSEELKKRDEDLVAQALSIWSMPTSSFKPVEKQLDSYSLDDDAPLTGRQISSFSYKGTKQPVSTWADMFQKVLQILYAEDKSIITKLAVSDEDKLATYFSMNNSDFRSCVEIGDGIYASTNTGTPIKLSVLNSIFALYDADTTDLVFYLKDEN